MNDHSPDFTDEQARMILARAIDLDARGPTTTLDDLRAIAAELGVSPGALEMAIQEQRTSLQHGRLAAANRAATRTTAIGLPLGVTVGVALSAGAVLPALGVVAVGLVASGALVVLHGSTGTLRSFHLKNSALWGGVCAGSVTAATILGDGVGLTPALITAGWCLRSWVASSILGSAGLLAARRAGPSDSSDAHRTGASVSPLRPTNRWSVRTRRLLAALTRPWQQVTSSLRTPPPLRHGSLVPISVPQASRRSA